MAKVFLGVPLYNWQMDFGCARSVFYAPSDRHEVFAMLSTSSLLAAGCNTLWCAALTAREQRGFDWFAMLHSDIDPGNRWVDTLISEAEEHDADFVSAVVPIKDGSGMTSTAFSDPADIWNPWCRLTLRQALDASFPTTFDVESASRALESLPDELACPAPPDGSLLMANTGCMVCRLDRPWVEDVWFEIKDRIERDPSGHWKILVLSEDWWFSRRIAECGGKVMATTAVKVKHKGSAEYLADVAAGRARDESSFLVREGVPHICTID